MPSIHNGIQRTTMPRRKKTAGQEGSGTAPEVEALDAPLSDEDLKLVRQLYLDGLPLHELALKFERQPITIAEAIRNGRTTELRCSFCGASHLDVIILIAGPLAYICEGCLQVCIQILVEEKPGLVQISIGSPKDPTDSV